MKKSIRLFLSVPIVALLTIASGYLCFKAIEQSIIEDNKVLVHNMAQQLLPFLLADDTQKVERLLKTLENHPEIQTAELISGVGIPLASYVREGLVTDPISQAQFALTSSDEALGAYGLHVAASLTFDTQMLASLHMTVNLWPAYLRMIQWLGLFLMTSSALYVVIKQKRIQVRFEKTFHDNGADFGGPFNIDQALQRALQNSDISLEYQPIKRVSDQGVFGAEVVVCWRHLSGQSLHVSPADFISLAENNGVFLPFGAWMLETAGKQFAAWQPQHGPLVLVINIAASQLKDPEFYQKVRDTCAVAQFPYQLIEYEINEAALLRLRTARVDVEAFVQQGLSLTVDGFGLSPHSHDLLQDLPIQKIKFAPQLVKNVAHDAEMLAYLQSFAQLANEREVQMMVDGLHSESQATVMQKLGCVLGQGPHFSQALSAPQFEAFLRDQIRDANVKQKTIQQNVPAAALSY